MTIRDDKAAAFKALHRRERGFLMLNAWDAGSAVILAREGAEAIGTTSAGIAFSLARPDFDAAPHLALCREVMFERLRGIVDAVGTPVNADLEHGYGEAPEAVAGTIRLAREAGLAGGNIEDHDPTRAHELYDETLSVERIKAARAAIGDGAFVLNAKTDAFTITPERGLPASIRRANLYLEAGADCAYPCGAADLETIGTLVREIAGPVNIVLGWGGLKASVAQLLDLGVKRVSVGGSIARAAFAFTRRAARELLDLGSNRYADAQIPQGELNRIFSTARLDTQG
jgi:2-methylisocitrate lyase-like PEP mutase family enzyme